MKSKSMLVLVLVIVSCLCVLATTRQGESAMKTRWEYKILLISDTQAHLSEKILNEQGAEGWELVQFLKPDSSPHGGTYYLKRAK